MSSYNAAEGLGSATLIFTDSAAAKVYELIQEEGNPNLHLRVFIQGGGCSGFQYGFTFDERIQQGDTVVEKTIQSHKSEHAHVPAQDGMQADLNGIVKLLVDPVSSQYLSGATIDYREDIHGEQFVISNPNAKTTCGCGSSFSI